MKSINDLPIIQFLYELNTTAFKPATSLDHKEYIESLRGKCKNPVKLSKQFVDCADKSREALQKLWLTVLKECNNENGVIFDGYADKSKVLTVYSIKDNIVQIDYWHKGIYHLYGSKTVFEDDGSMHYESYFVCGIPNEQSEQTIKAGLCLLLTYLTMREYADVEVKTVQTYYQKEIVKAGKKKTTTEEGVPYYTFDSKWYTEICNDNIIGVSGYFRMQHGRLVWVDAYTRRGPHRKAGIDKYKDGEVSI